ncbi:hypothetical protein NEDG_00517 [Nematocida displodere]|uniref:Uncharacterized protein n=1 Tax=Nematocida displodere TaxID=1805483 RepID=A0A177ELR0_9MICR|nr:hypothetical protein NEDG_00517 [Nematocida displodere]
MVSLKLLFGLGATMAGVIYWSFLLMKNSGNLLPRTEHTDPTIAFLKKISLEVETSRLFWNKQLMKQQHIFINLTVKHIGLEDIPEQLEPGIELEGVFLIGESGSDSLSNGTEKKICKILRALKGVPVKILSIKNCNNEEQTFSIPCERTPLSISTIVSLECISPAFLEWFGAALDFGKCLPGLDLEIFDCGIESVKCLNGLGFKSLSTLCLRKMEKLKSLDCPALIEACNNNLLTLWSLSNPLEIPETVALAIAEKKWKEINIDLMIWNTICQMVKREISVSKELFLNVTSLKELGADASQWKTGDIGAKSVEIYDSTEETLLRKEFVELAMQWVYENVETVVKVHILPLLIHKQTDPELEIKRLEDILPEIASLPNLVVLKINQRVRVSS